MSHVPAMERPAGRRWERVVCSGRAALRGHDARALLVLLIPVALIGWVFWPGAMSADTLAQIKQADQGHFTNQHAPLLMALWYPFFNVGLGPGWVLTLQLACFVAGSYLVLRTALRPVPAAGWATAITLSPVTFGMLGFLSRDTWFATLVVLGFGAAARARQRPAHAGRWLALALVAGWLAVAARQNGPAQVWVLFALLVAAVLPGVLARRPRLAPILRTRRRAVAAAAVGGLLVSLLVMGSQSVAQRVIGTKDVHPQQYSMIYDLAAISHREGRNLFPPSVMPRRDMESLEYAYNPSTPVGFIFSKPQLIKYPLSTAAYEDLAAAWRRELRRHPLAYLSARLEFERRMLTIGERAVVVYHPEVDRNRWGYAYRHREANAQGRDYVEGFADDFLQGGVLYTLWAYLVAAVLAGIYLVRRAAVEAKVPGLLALSAVSLQLGLMLTAPSVQYRLQLPLVVAAMLAVVVAVATRRRLGRGPIEAAAA